MSKIEVRCGGMEIPVTFSTFPGGEEYVKVDLTCGNIMRQSTAIITAAITDSTWVMRLAMLTDALKRIGAPRIFLNLPYVPYGRQDRVCNPGESLSIKVFCDLINSMDLDGVTIVDPHSDVTPALLNNCKVVTTAALLSAHSVSIGYENTSERKSLESSILVSPDAGANKKVFEVAKALKISDVVRADKVRDVATGNITDTVVYSNHVGDRDFLIVDDICDGGRTFIELGKKLKELTNGKVMLYVTHLIAGKGTSVFDDVIDELYYYHCFDESKLDSKVVKHKKVYS